MVTNGHPNGHPLALRSGEKDVDEQAIKRSVRDLPKQQSDHIPGNEFAGLFILNQSIDEFEPWGLNHKLRDRQLRAFITSEPTFASALGIVCSSNSAYKWELDGPPRTVDATQNMLLSANDGAGWQDLVNKVSIDLYCLAATSTILLGGDRLGQRKRIRDMVREHDVGPVVTVGPDGRMTERKVIQWERTPLANRRWVWLAVREAMHHAGSRRGGLFITEDHPVLTGDGWLPAGQVRRGMMVATGDPAPAPEQEALIAGMVLGDSGLHPTKNRTGLSVGHSPKQEQWLELKVSALRGFMWRPQANYHKERPHLMRLMLKTSGLNAMYRHWYTNKKKHVDREAVERLFSPMMLAAWYGDDGSLCGMPKHKLGIWKHGAYLATDGFTREDTSWLAWLLTKNGIQATVHQGARRKIGDDDGGYYHRIYVGVEGAQKLFETVAPYMPECMRYKLPDDAAPFNPDLWELPAALPFMDKVIHAKFKKYPSSATYHLGVEETRNFVAGNMVVHNTQDNGAFIEIVRDGKQPTSAAIGLNHLDSARAWHTGDPRAPVVYQDRMGRLHLMNWWEVITLSDMPCAIEGKYGLQYSALTRLLLSARIMKNIAIYEDEKSGGRHTRGIFLVAGMTTEQIRTALQEQRAVADSAGLRRFVLPPILGSVDPQAKVDVKEINFAGLPDNFDKEVANKLYINSIAMAFQRDYQDFAPLPGGGLGTSAQSHVLNMKSRGKGPGLFMAMLTHAINHRVLPDNVEFSFHEQDLDAEQAEAAVTLGRAQTRQIMVMTGTINAQESRQLAADDGDIPPEFLTYDITPALVADDDDQIDPANKPKPLKPPAGTPDAAQPAQPAPDQQKLQSGEKSAYRHDTCMDKSCTVPPTYEVLWAEGRAHAWFCDEHLHAWEAEHPYEINAFWPLADGRASRNVTRNKALANVGLALLNG